MLRNYGNVNAVSGKQHFAGHVAAHGKAVGKNSGSQHPYARMHSDDAQTTQESRNEVLEEAAEIYELYTIALYDKNGKLLQGVGDAPDKLNETFFPFCRKRIT